ncbi:MAG: 4-(cytidine 5'-diphospho)-2-C-methyl-D-erythritol kinase [Pirellulales bacterium]
MYLRRDHLKRTARAPAKLNLYLEILGRRGDGFHELETLMVPIRLADRLALTPTPPIHDRAGQIVLDIRNCLPVRPPPASEDVPAGPANLVVKALELLRELSGCRWGAHVELDKRIPSGAGLGGASSDAAAALRLANRAWQLEWSNDRLALLAAEIGSDVPFFLSGGPAICRGRGERVEPVRGLAPLDFVIVKPPVGLNTAEVYQSHDALPDDDAVVGLGEAYQVAGMLGSDRWHTPGIWMRNRLQAAAAALSPWVERLRGIFDSLDCLGHQLTGSGSAYFGVCRHARHARRLATLLKTRQLGLVYATQSYL